MTSRKDGAEDQCWYGTCEYSSAQLDTKGHFQQQYGLFAADIKLPRGRGLWPAFWMVGANTGQVSPADSGEIDVVEINNQSPANVITAFAHLHNQPQYTPMYTLSTPLSAAYHVYEVDWTSSGITFLVDGHAYGNVATQAGPPFNQPFYLILSLAVGGKWPGSPDSSTVFPNQMDVAWIRAYTRK